MPTYTFRCDSCGPFDVIAPMTSRPDEGAGACPRCDQKSRRVYAAPSLLVSSRSLRLAKDQADRSAEAPLVVRSEAPSGGELPKPLRRGNRPSLPRW